MKAVIWTGDNHFEVHSAPEPTPGKGQVVVKVEAAAICGTDFHYADFESKPPIIPGHEVAGVVVEKDAAVTSLNMGDAVALDPVQRCGTCYACTHDIGHLCMNTRHLGGERAPGGWAEYVAVDAVNAHRIPAGVSFSAAALAEPAAVCYESFKRAHLRANQDVLVIGDGPFGFLHAVMARILGARTIIVAGHYDERLKRIVKETGAIACNTHHHDVLDVVKEKTDGLGVDVVVDATGAGPAPNMGIAALKPRGVLVIFSLIWKPQAPDFGMISFKELTIVGSCRSLDCFGPCLAWMSEGKIPADKLVDIQAPLDEVNDAIGQLTARKKDIFKAVLLPYNG